MQTIGERLEDARKKKGISIREAAEATKIRGEYLQKFEGNQFEIGLTEIYTRGFLRGYANYLRIPSDRLLNDYTRAARRRAPRAPAEPRGVRPHGPGDLLGRRPRRGAGGGRRVRVRPAAPAGRFQRPGENLPKGAGHRPGAGVQGRHRPRGVLLGSW